MTAIRLIFGVFVGLIAITVVAESVEFLTIKIVTGKQFSELTEVQNEYFEIRNTTWILVFKSLYSFIAGVIGGYLATWISSGKPQLALILLIGIQVLSLVWAGFLSELSATGPLWMWIYLILVIPLGIFIGHKMRVKKKNALQQSL